MIGTCFNLQIWGCLAENAVYPCDRDYCFRWFSKVRLNALLLTFQF